MNEIELRLLQELICFLWEEHKFLIEDLSDSQIMKEFGSRRLQFQLEQLGRIFGDQGFIFLEFADGIRPHPLLGRNRPPHRLDQHPSPLQIPQHPPHGRCRGHISLLPQKNHQFILPPPWILLP